MVSMPGAKFQQFFRFLIAANMDTVIQEPAKKQRNPADEALKVCG